MSESVFAASAFSVAKVFGICALGAWLGARGSLDRDTRRKVSQVIFTVMLPGLLLAKVSSSASLEHLVQWAWLPVAALGYIGAGFVVGGLSGRLFGRGLPDELRRVAAAATAFGNSGYIPLPLIAAIAGAAPVFARDPTAADRGIAYVSIYLVAMSPCLWGIGYPYLGGSTWRSLTRAQILTAPVIAVLAAVLLGACPPLRSLFVAKGAPGRLVLDIAGLAGEGAVPCALLVLGANVIEGAGVSERLPYRAIVGVCLGRLVLMPALGCAVTLMLRRAGLLPQDPMFALVLMLEGAVPAATNLIIMCQVHHRGENAMANLLFWNYLAAIPSLTVFVAVFLWVLGNP